MFLCFETKYEINDYVSVYAPGAKHDGHAGIINKLNSPIRGNHLVKLENGSKCKKNKKTYDARRKGGPEKLKKKKTRFSVSGRFGEKGVFDLTILRMHQYQMWELEKSENSIKKRINLIKVTKSVVFWSDKHPPPKLPLTENRGVFFFSLFSVPIPSFRRASFSYLLCKHAREA